MEPICTVKLLGGISIHRSGQEPVHLHITKPSLLLALLALNLRSDLSRDKLIDTLWPDPEAADGHHSLAQALLRLKAEFTRADLEPNSALHIDRSCVRLNPDIVTTDLRQLRIAAGRAERVARADERLDLLRYATRLYRGELIPGSFDDWILGERERTTAVFLNLLRRLISELKNCGQIEEALDHALKGIAVANDLEPIHEEVVKLYIEAGREQEAIRHYLTYREWRTREELGSPGERLLGIMEPFEVRLNTLLARPRQRDSQNNLGTTAVGDDAAAIRAALNGGPVRIAASAGQFFGRDSELGKITNLLLPGVSSDPLLPETQYARLVTVTGPEGWGKTRLVVEAADRMRAAFQDHLVFVPMRRAARADSVTHLIANALHVYGTGDSQAGLIRDKLRLGPWLLVLDNCEHADRIGRVVQMLLDDAPDLRVLATSPAPLGVSGEHLVTLRPLAVPRTAISISSPEEFPSVQMFMNRARFVCPDLHLSSGNAESISAIVTRLEGVPLAIELAAERSRLLSPTQILSALENRFELLVSFSANRRISFWDALDRSFRLLSGDARRLLVSLSVFDGGFTLDAVRAVCASSLQLSGLDALIRSSFLDTEFAMDVVRFSMLDSLREFAAEQLHEGERETLAARHAAYFLGLLYEGALPTSARRAALRAVKSEQANVMAAVAYARSMIEAGIRD